MAIAGGGVPSVRVAIINNKLHQFMACNVPSEIAFTAEKAAGILTAAPKAMPYVLIENNGTHELHRLLLEGGVIHE